MIDVLEFPLRLRERLRTETIAAFPRECCGLIEGACEESAARATALHPLPNIAAEPDRFEIDPAAPIALLRRLRGADRAIIGCYHSHPNGRAEPSARDEEGADEDGFLWVIAAVEGVGAEPRIAAFVSTATGFSPVQVETR
ncbi:MAG TPA: M67 family metallopeptidase [Rhizomicrobium sp.]